jgi:HlyD family secretion protein
MMRNHPGRWTRCAVVGALLISAWVMPAAGQTHAPAGNGVGALGRVEPQSGLIELGAGPADRVLSLAVKVGDTVKKGQVLGTLDTYPVQVAAREEAAAQLAEAQTRVKAQTALGQARIAQAGKQKGDLPIRIARASADAALATIPVASLSKALAVAEARVAAATIVAPIDGTILAIRRHPGESIGSGPILTMGDVRKMTVRAEVYETDIPRVRVGQTATMTSGALAKPLSGHVTAIGGMVSRNSVFGVSPTARVDARVVPVRIDLDDPAAVAGLSNLTVDVVIAAPPAVKRGTAQAAGK